MPEVVSGSDISQWQSITTLVVFLLSNLAVLFPFHIPIFIYRPFANKFLGALAALRFIPPRNEDTREVGDKRSFIRLRFPIDLTTGPLIGVLFLLSIKAIGQTEVYGGTVGANNISPIDIVVFAFTIGYIGSSIDCTGFIRYLTVKVIHRYGETGHSFFLSVYVAFFLIGCFFGNDIVIQMGMLFLTYMIRLARNIVHPRAWIHTQFALANIASTILISSSTTNVVVAQAFQIGFAEYTANVAVPVTVAVMMLGPFLLYIVFSNESLIPTSVLTHELPKSDRPRRPVGPNLRPTRVLTNTIEDSTERYTQYGIETIMNPYLEKPSAFIGITIMASTLIVLLALTAANLSNFPVFWVTLPASFLMACWDAAFGWVHRQETRTISHQGSTEIRRFPQVREQCREEDSSQEWEAAQTSTRPAEPVSAISRNQEISIHQGQDSPVPILLPTLGASARNSFSSVPSRDRPLAGTFHFVTNLHVQEGGQQKEPGSQRVQQEENRQLGGQAAHRQEQRPEPVSRAPQPPRAPLATTGGNVIPLKIDDGPEGQRGPQTLEDGPPISVQKPIADEEKAVPWEADENVSHTEPRTNGTLVSLLKYIKERFQQTFPTVSTVVALLPFQLIPFAFPIFILVQSLASTGWITLFAEWWGVWAGKTGTIGSIGGMGFLSVILSNFTGTNIGATVLLARVLQVWADLQEASGNHISERTFWGTVYALTIGVNYGAFSLTFGASLAGLGWREDLRRRDVYVRRLEFFRVNMPIIAFTMAISSVVLIGEVYIMRDDTPYSIRSEG